MAQSTTTSAGGSPTAARVPSGDRPSSIADFESAGQQVAEIPVHINYDIIRLFSEGLYQSPNKAIEELVTNSYDADARDVHVLAPANSDNAPLSPLWVVDNGTGLDEAGFHQLWQIADSKKKNASSSTGRLPIGQFGIGKLAAYVLANKLLHISRVKGQLRLTTMDFTRAKGRQTDGQTVSISLRKVDENTARHLLADIRTRDRRAWDLMFGNHDHSWTAAGLYKFKSLYEKLHVGTLRWVLRTGLPLLADFKVWLNGDKLTSSKEQGKLLKEVKVDETIPDIGQVAGHARIFETELTRGKSQHVGRSNGFFLRVRGRVINLHDPLFGVEQPNHSAWVRFAMDVKADGLQNHLLSSREGVKHSASVEELRALLFETFNTCRRAYDAWVQRNRTDLDIVSLLAEKPSIHILDPLFHSVREAASAGEASFYFGVPKTLKPENLQEWLENFRQAVSDKPIAETTFVRRGASWPSVHYKPEDRSLEVNLDHPFVEKMVALGKDRSPAKLFAASEILLEGQLGDYRDDPAAIAGFLGNRDYVLRLIAGHGPLTTHEVLRQLERANDHRDALERATGNTFCILGFEYIKRGGNTSGPDGVLTAPLGRQGTLANYRVVYDAKQSKEPSVSASRVDITSLETFRKDEEADFAFFIANAYANESSPQSKLNRLIENMGEARITVLKIEHLRRLIEIHQKYGLTLMRLRELFEQRTIAQVDNWLQETEECLRGQGEISLSTLLRYLEEEKADDKAAPNVKAARRVHSELTGFSPEQLIARLKAVQTLIGSEWIEVFDSGDVWMRSTAKETVDQIERSNGNIRRDETISVGQRWLA